MAEKEHQSGGTDDGEHLHVSLREAILIGSLAAGSALVVGLLVRKHHVSKEAASTALRRLEAEGLVDRETHDRVVVADPVHGRFGDLKELVERWRNRTKRPDAFPGSDFP